MGGPCRGTFARVSVVVIPEGLEGYEALTYLTGVVAQYGVLVEQGLERVIQDLKRYVGNTDEPPLSFKRGVDFSLELVATAGFEPRVEEAMRVALKSSSAAMKERNRVIHDAWYQMVDDNPMRWSRIMFERRPMTSFVRATVDFEQCIGDLLRSWNQLHSLTWIYPDSDGNYFFEPIEPHLAIARGDLTLGADGGAKFGPEGS